MRKPLAIDLFCGAGGMSEGLLQAGFHIVFSSDKSEEASLTYKKRHEQLGLKNGYNTSFHTMDICELTGKFIKKEVESLDYFKENNIEIKEIDAIFGGPPCQGFSRAGLRKKDDPRNLLFKQYLRVISEVKPNYVVMENVVGLLDTKLDGFVGVFSDLYPDKTLVAEILESEFEKIGYSIKDYGKLPNGKIDFKKMVLNASKFGVPQKRERIIVIAYKKGLKEPVNIENYKKVKKVTIAEAIGDLIIDSNKKNKVLQKIENRDYIEASQNGRTPNFITKEPIKKDRKELKNLELSKHLGYIKERFSLFKEGESAKNVFERINKNGFDDIEKIGHIIYHIYKEFSLKYGYLGIDELKKDIENIMVLDVERRKELLLAILSKKNMRVKLRGDEPSRTVVTLPDDYISPFEDRTLSVRELARLQSFDDSFVFQGKRTTGGDRRKFEVPQYTQVGNAVPPLLAKAVAQSIIDVL